MYDLAELDMTVGSRSLCMVSPCDLFTTDPARVQLLIHYSFMRFPEAERYRQYSLMVAAWLQIHKMQQNTFSNQGGVQSVLKSDLDKYGFPKSTQSNDEEENTVPDCHPKLKHELVHSLCTSLRRLELEGILYPLDSNMDEKHSQQSGTPVGPVDSFGFPAHPTLPEDDSLDDIGDDIFGVLHWRAARIHADMLDLPYSFVQIIDLHMILMYIECVLVGENFNDLELEDVRQLISDGRNDMQYNPDILQMLDRLQSVLEDTTFLHFVSIIEDDDLFITEQQSNGKSQFELDDEGFPLPHESFLTKQSDTEPVLDADGFPQPSKSSKHEQYVDCVEDIVDILTTLKTLTERRKVRSFVNRAARQIALLKEHIKLFEDLGRIPADGNLEVKEIVSKNNAKSQTESTLMQSDALDINEAQQQFLETTTDETGHSPPKEVANTMAFTKHRPNTWSSEAQKPNRNAPASMKLGNTDVNLSGVAEEYRPERKAGSEFFAFG